MAPPLAARVPIILALLVAVAAALAPLAAAQPWPVCDAQSGNYSAGSAYAANLLRLVSVLRANASN